MSTLPNAQPVGPSQPPAGPGADAAATETSVAATSEDTRQDGRDGESAGTRPGPAQSAATRPAAAGPEAAERTAGTVAATGRGPNRPRRGGGKGRPGLRWRVTAGLLALIGAVLVLTPHSAAPRPMPLSTALTEIDKGHVAAATLTDGTHEAILTFTDHTKRLVVYPYTYGKDFTADLVEHHVQVTVEPVAGTNLLLEIVLQLLPVALIVAFLMLFMRNQGGLGGLSGLGGKRGKPAVIPATRFSDVAGADEAVAELREAVAFLNNPAAFAATGARPSRGFLLVGPPGTGKTLLARAVAGEAGVPVFTVAGSEFVQVFVGMGARRVRELFDRARSQGKAIIFIDEIDAIGKARGAAISHGGTDERESTLLQLLTELDGFAAREGIIVLAATNRADVLDPALTRPGRFDRTVAVPAPDVAGRERILRLHAASIPARGVDYATLARRTPGMTGADLAGLVNEAALVAARRGASEVSDDDFDAAVATLTVGRARTSAVVTEHDRNITAWHEAGHAVAALVQPEADKPTTCTIVPRGAAGGVTFMAGTDHQFLTRAAAHAKLVVAMAGRAGEQIHLGGQYTQGASGDLRSATSLATAMVTEWGMSELGPAHIPGELLTSGTLADAVHAQVNALLRQAAADAQALLDEHRDLLEALVGALLEAETLRGDEMAALAAAHPGRSAAG